MTNREKFAEQILDIACSNDTIAVDTEKEEEIHDSYGDLLKWLQSEAE